MIGDFDSSNLTNIAPDDSAGSSDFLPFGYAGIWAAFPFAIWFFLAIEGVPLAAEETDNPKRDMPRGLIAGMAVLLVFAALMLTIAPGSGGADTIMDSDNPLPAAIDEAKGDGAFLGDFVNYIGLAGLIASFFSIIYGYSRQLFALSRAGYLPKALSVTSSRKVPWLALLVPAAIGFLLAAITEDGATMLNIAVFGAAVSYVLMMLSHIVLRSREPDLERPYRTPGGTLTTGVALVLAVAAVVATFLVDTTAAFITLGVYAAAAAVLRPLLAPPPRRLGARGGVRLDQQGRSRAGALDDLDELEKAVKDGSIDTVLLGFADMQGRFQGKRLVADHFLEEVVSHGAEACNYLLAVDVDMNTVDGYAMSSWETGYGDFEMKPDFDTLRLVPWHEGTAMCMADLQWHGDKPVAASPRQILRRQLDRLAERGWTAFAATELEFIVFRDTYEQAFHKRYQDLEPGNLYNVDYSMLGTSRRGAADRPHPARDGARRAAGGELQGRVQLRPARDQLHLRDRAARRRHAHDLQERRQGDRRPGGHGDHVHGQVRRARGQLVPHPPLRARRGRHAGVRRAARAVRPLPRRPARVPARDDAVQGAATSTPTSASPRARSPRPRSPGAATTARARCA